MKWFSLLINTKNNQPLSSFPLWSFNTPKPWQTANSPVRPNPFTHLCVRAPKPCAVMEKHPLPPALRTQKGPGVDWTPYDRISFWASLSESRQLQIRFHIPHAKTWPIDISLCMRLLLPAVMGVYRGWGPSLNPDGPQSRRADRVQPCTVNGVTICCCGGQILKWDLEMILKRKTFMAQSCYIETILLQVK